MIFTETAISGVFIIDVEKKEDERGYLARTWCKKEFDEHGIHVDLLQGYSAFTKKKGTIRGMHYQVEPYAEAKLTRCIKGAIYEVVIDLRVESKTYKKWIGYTLSSSDNRLMFMPENTAHGYITLQDNTEFVNHSSMVYASEYEKGLRYDDPAFNISWPISIEYISKKDLHWENFK